MCIIEGRYLCIVSFCSILWCFKEPYERKPLLSVCIKMTYIIFFTSNDKWVLRFWRENSTSWLWIVPLVLFLPFCPVKMHLLFFELHFAPFVLRKFEKTAIITFDTCTVMGICFYETYKTFKNHSTLGMEYIMNDFVMFPSCVAFKLHRLTLLVCEVILI